MSTFVLDEEDRAIIARIVNTYAVEAFNKFSAGAEEHGGRLIFKQGLLRESAQEVLDLSIYLFAVREQLCRVEEALKSHRYDAAYLMLRGILHGKPSDLLPE